MTVINGNEIDCTHHEPNQTNDAIANNDPIDDVLHVICVVSNPCLYARRYVLMNEFLMRMKHTQDVVVYVVELCYQSQSFVITDSKNPRHLQLRATDVLWHKENMINLGVNLLPPKWKAMAWIDADIEFENARWANDTLRVLNGYKDIVQLFSHCLDMDRAQNTMRTWNSAGYQYERHHRHVSTGADYSHPGYAWAMTRKAYDRMGGLFDLGILGSSDHVMLHALVGKVKTSIHPESHPDYLAAVLALQERMYGLRFGYVPGVIRHFFHGTKENRKYAERWHILIKFDYKPSDLVRKSGLLHFREKNEEFQAMILQYFWDRKEDD
jgi:hypothetical protein